MTEKVLCLFCHCVCSLNHKCGRVTSTDGYRGWTYCPPAGQGRELFAYACSGIGGVRAEPGEGQVPPESKLTPTLPPWIPRLPMSGETLPGGLHTGSGHSQKSKLPTGFLVKGLDIHPATGLQELGSPEEQKAPQDQPRSHRRLRACPAHLPARPVCTTDAAGRGRAATSGGALIRGGLSIQKVSPGTT